ncbi:MAG: hypothetical protein EA424_10270 [Planctomycetaceae bacterium]|nr:MAG: hypothetical protein EA424_10270 [Planctomycetaceae bacterium]
MIPIDKRNHSTASPEHFSYTVHGHAIRFQHDGLVIDNGICPVPKLRYFQPFDAVLSSWLTHQRPELSVNFEFSGEPKISQSIACGVESTGAILHLQSSWYETVCIFQPLNPTNSFGAMYPSKG